MGNKESATKKTEPHPPMKVPTQDNTNNTAGDENASEPHIENEASPFIYLIIYNEFPSGTTEEHTVTTSPQLTVSQFKNDLQHPLRIPPESMQIFRHNGEVELLPDDNTLRSMGIREYDKLRVRNRELQYTTV